MKRTFSTKRIYSLKPYETIAFEDTIEIEGEPDKLLNQEFVEEIYQMQMNTLDANYTNYITEE